MGFRLSLKGNNEEILLEKENITDVKFSSDTADSSNARSTDINIGLEIQGKVIPSIGSEMEDDSRKLLKWSMVSSEELDAYRNLELEIISAGKVVRKINMPNTFVIDYIENFNDKSGNGTFLLKVKQKKEKIKDISVEGGYESK